MKGISRRLSPVFLWLSLHDITPTVIALNRIVYCHNSFPFYAWKMRDLLFAPKIVLFALFSKYAYRKNIHKNNYVIVQQQWLRNEFVRLFNLSAQSIIVAPPSFHPVKHDFFISKSSLEYSFFFPAVADSHKNFECICSAAHLLEQSLGANKFRVYITVEGTENSYARWLYHKWSKNRALSFIGYLNEEELSEYYQRCDCLIFPSKVETWGLPISEFAIYNKPMLLADLPYAHETAGGCSRVAFFNPDSPNELAVHMKRLIQGNTYSLRSVENTIIPPPTAYSWKDLFDFITK
jgi:glycosyltransferase involved in cell wall biosynthesis